MLDDESLLVQDALLVDLGRGAPAEPSGLARESTVAEMSETHEIAAERCGRDRRDDDEADRDGHGDDDRQERADDPDELEPCLETGEGSTAVGIGSIALDDRIEGLLGEAAGGADEHREHGRAGETPDQRAQHAGDDGEQERTGEDPLLADDSPHTGSHDRADEEPELGEGRHQSELPQRSAPVLEAEGQHE